jgi:hypothetical protein
MVKLSQTSITFSTSDDMFLLWLNAMYDLNTCQEVFIQALSDLLSLTLNIAHTIVAPTISSGDRGKG